ncbi:MAG: hypothetical protein ABIR78_06920 [Ferruginibacter sp.]
MKLQLLLILTIIVLVSCNSRKKNDPTPVSTTPVTETVQPKDPLGQRISTIEIKLKATKEELETFEDGVVPWINMEETNKEIIRLIDPDKIVLPYPSVTLIIDYPLNTPAMVALSTIPQGFTFKQIILEISKKYHELYALEESTATTKTVPMSKRKGLINRNETNGKFGVCCHDLADLVLSSIWVYQNSKGKITLMLEIES